MVDPISLTVASMQNDVQRMDVISNNAANSLTPGFKRELVAAAGRLSAPAQGAMGGLSGTVPSQTRLTDSTPGAPKRTSNPLDVALMGDGLFELSTDRGAAYTRMGSFHIDEKGRLVSQSGFPVAGISGDIVLKSPNPVIDAQGRVFENGAQIGQLKVVSFERPSLLSRAGGGLMFAPGGMPAQEMKLARVLQGHLESSNVDSAREMVNMVETYRHFESSNRLLQAYDDMSDKAFRSLGQF